MRVASVASAFPALYYGQDVILQALKPQWGTRLARPGWLERVHRRAGVEGLVLEEVMQHPRPAPGTWGLPAALGPGFCSELVLLRW